MLSVKITTLGSSVGIVLPKEALAKLNAEKGDMLFLVETPEGYQITPYDESFEKQMKLAEKGMKKYRHTLRKLAE